MPQVNFKRKEVRAAQPIWELVDDCVAGEIAVKKAGDKYLPKPTGEKDPKFATARYEAYKTRAVFYPATGRTLDGLVGQVFSKDSTIDLPPELDRYKEDIDGLGTPLEQQAKTTLGAIVSKGHGGLLADFPSVEDSEDVTEEDIEKLRIRPRILFIEPERIINWRIKVVGGESLLSLIMIEEDAVIKDDGYKFETEKRWREYRLLEKTDEVTEEVTFEVHVLLWRKKDDTIKVEGSEFELVDGYPIKILDANQQPFDRIPFEFLGSKSNEPRIDKAPLGDLAHLNVAHYRNSADYEESCYLTGQPTPVVSGLSKDWAKDFIEGKVILGSRAAVPLEKGSTMELIQAEANTMPFEAMGHKEEQMRSVGAKLIDESSTKGTATEAIIEESSESSILSSATKNVSNGYEKSLYHASKFVGEVDPDKIIFQLNSDFEASRMTAQERAQLIAEWQSGGITWEEYRAQLKKAGVATEDDEKAKKKIEDTIVPPDDGFDE